MEAAYKIVDYNKDGFLSVEDWELWVDNIERDVNPDPNLIDTLRTRMREYCAGMGITPGVKATMGEFIKGMAAMAERERAKRLRGDETLLERLNHAWYDVVDTNHDGCVTLEEYRKVLKACNLDPSTADQSFKVIDKNQNGKIERSELTNFEFQFWFMLDDEDSDEDEEM